VQIQMFSPTVPHATRVNWSRESPVSNMLTDPTNRMKPSSPFEQLPIVSSDSDVHSGNEACP
jgi:hypothetical protein